MLWENGSPCHSRRNTPNFVRISGHFSSEGPSNAYGLKIKYGKMGEASFTALEQEGKNIRDTPGNTTKDKERECCMCGDVGFQELLFKCHRCHHRFQHLYCSRLFSDQLDLDGANVCEWCLHFQAKEKIQSQKKKLELQEMGSKNGKKVPDSDLVAMSAYTSAMEQPASVTMKKPRKANAKPSSLKLDIKFGGSKKSQFGGSKKKQISSLLQRCKVTAEPYIKVPRTSALTTPNKGGFRRRYKLLSDVLDS